METNLRPMTLGEILDRTANLYRSHFLLFAGIASVYAGALLAVGLGQIGLNQLLKSSKGWEALANVAVFLVLCLLTFILSGIAVAANNRAVAWVHLGQPASVRAAYASVLPKTGRYVWLMVIVSFLVGWPIALIYTGYATALAVYLVPMAKAGGAGGNKQAQLMVLGLLTLAFVLLLILGAVYAVIMGLRYSLAVPASVVEDLKARQAIKRSVALSKGSRGRIFVLGLLAVIIAVGLVLVTQGFFFFQIFRHHGELPPGMQALQQFVGFLTNTFVGPIYATGLTLFYYDQRVRKEGYDIEWMMQAAGMTAEQLQVPQVSVAGGDAGSLQG